MVIRDVNDMLGFLLQSPRVPGIANPGSAARLKTTCHVFVYHIHNQAVDGEPDEARK